MALFRQGGWQGVALALLISAAQGQGDLSRSDFGRRADQLAAQLGPSTAQGLEFGQVSLAFIPGQYVAADSSRIFMAMVMPQMWLSDNLAAQGGVGFGVGAEQLVQMLRISLIYLPATLTAWGWQPEVMVAQNRIDGLPEMSTVKWNEARWSYKKEVAGWQLSTGLTLLFQRIFINGDFSIDGKSARVVRSTRMANFSLGRRLFGSMGVTGRLVAGDQALTIGIEMSAAL